MVTGGAAALSKPVLGSSEKTSTWSPNEAYKYSPLESVQRDAMGDAVLAMRYGFPSPQSPRNKVHGDRIRVGLTGDGQNDRGGDPTRCGRDRAGRMPQLSPLGAPNSERQALPTFCKTNHLEPSMRRRESCRDGAVAESVNPGNSTEFH